MKLKLYSDGIFVEIPFALKLWSVVANGEVIDKIGKIHQRAKTDIVYIETIILMGQGEESLIEYRNQI